jgi:pimeloyl-ACP methyl ester carboxylesterase
VPCPFLASRPRRAALGWLCCALAVTACGAIAPAPAPPRRRVLLSEGAVRIDVIVEGSGPTVVLLPSSLRDSEDFDELAARMAAAGFKVLRPQPRGMGASRGPMHDLSLHVLAADVAATVRQLGDGRAVLVGHAFGHFVARVTDLDHPQRVRGIVIAGAAARTFPPGVAPSLAIASDPTQAREARLRGLRHAFFAPGNDPTPWLEGWHPTLREAYRQAGAVPAKEVWWPVSHAPILDLQGADDPWRPPATRNELKDALGDKVMVQVVPRASHALIPEQPDAVARAIVDWIATLPR